MFPDYKTLPRNRCTCAGTESSEDSAVFQQAEIPHFQFLMVRIPQTLKNKQRTTIKQTFAT